MTKNVITGSIYFPGSTKEEFQAFATANDYKLSAFMVEAARVFIERADFMKLKTGFESEKYFLVPRGTTPEDLRKAAEILELLNKEG